MVYPFFCVTIVKTTIIYWTNIALSKISGGYYSKEFDDWIQKPETKAKLALAQKNAWDQLTKQFPNADKTKFKIQTSVDDNYNISAEVFLKASSNLLQSVFGSDRKYWSLQMTSALGLGDVGGFPYQLSPLKTDLLANPRNRFHSIGPEHCLNLQQREQNLCHARRLFHHKIL